ncbi:outer membrane beta-barrel protein [Isoalcanivorax beigongshangi]|uniref:Outer membrane beta-barrel protein n=1 Tax=Isoalcanivorax beigongshangi TaxID=3238810 RepID=A0ABV4AFC6_9GAMM
MKKICLAAAVAGVSLLCSSAAVAAEPEGYVAVRYGNFEQYDRFFGKDRFETGEVSLAVVGGLGEYFEGELRLGRTLDAEERGKDRFQHDLIASYFLRAGYSVGPVRPYLSVGYTYVREQYRTNGHTYRDSVNDFSYGAGIDVSLGARLGVSLEYMHLYHKGNLRLDGTSAGVFWRF